MLIKEINEIININDEVIINDNCRHCLAPSVYAYGGFKKFHLGKSGIVTRILSKNGIVVKYNGEEWWHSLTCVTPVFDFNPDEIIKKWMGK